LFLRYSWRQAPTMHEYYIIKPKSLQGFAMGYTKADGTNRYN
jgi:hypothetical protein